MTQEDDAFYKDNCFGTYKAICTTTVPKDWARQKKRKDNCERSAEKKKRATESRLAEQKRLDESEMSEVFNTPIDSESDPSFSEPQTSKKSLFTNCKLCSSKEQVQEETNEK